MANAALATWGVKFLSALDNLTSAIAQGARAYYGAGKGNEDGKKYSSIVNPAISQVLSLRSELVGTLNSSTDPGRAGAIIAEFDKITKNISLLSSAKYSDSLSGIISSLLKWYNSNIKPLS